MLQQRSTRGQPAFGLGAQRLALLLLSFAQLFSQAFVLTPQNTFTNDKRTFVASAAAGQDSVQESSKGVEDGGVDLVLFGLGDLRVDDHVGLHRALTKTTNSKTIPLCVLDNKSLACMPGAVAHTADTARCIHHALLDLKEELKSRCGLSLQTIVDTDNAGLAGCIANVCEQLTNAEDDGDTTVRLHVCDLGSADNQIGYGPYAQLAEGATLPDNVEVMPWAQDLRAQPWEAVDTLPENYIDYEKQYLSQSVSEPVDIASQQAAASIELDMPSASTDIPTANELLEKLKQVLSKKNPLLEQTGRVECSASSGLYMTHWGGLASETIGCRAAYKVVDVYASACGQDDEDFSQCYSYPARQFKRNRRSLEHAAMNWQLEGDGSCPAGNVNNWMAGEAMTRFLTGPLLLGTMSPRRIWSLSKKSASEQTSLPFLSFMPPLERMVEAREWHRLLAAKNIASDAAYQTADDSSEAISYRYWRYQGFLCRYAVTPMTKSSAKEEKKAGVLLVHGFGASGAQWNKAMASLTEQQQSKSTEVFQEGLAPDLLGFGESEKPAISYTGYMWDAQVSDFIKECAVGVHGWKSFVVGGNSIGGFTSVSVAASDAASIEDCKKNTVSSSGAPGTGLCTGLVLMNSAGPIKTQEEIEEEQKQADEAFAADRNRLPKYSIAQVTAMDALPLCSPPWRPVGRAFGNALLLYLRPRIQSICVNLYPTNPDAVDDTLCGSIERDSLDPGAVNVMMAGAKLPVPRTFNELLAADHRMGLSDGSAALESVFDGPVLVAQGVLDPLNDAKDRMQRLGALRQGVTMDPIEAGHCPHDEQPELVATSILKWMEATASEQADCIESASTVPA